MNAIRATILSVTALLIAVTIHAENNSHKTEAEKKVFFSRYTTRFLIQSRENRRTRIGIEGIQHYKNDLEFVRTMNITRMWIEDEETIITFVESANVTPQGDIDFKNIFILYQSGRSCIEKSTPKENLNENKRGVKDICTAKQLTEARHWLAFGEEKATEEIKKARRKEAEKNNPHTKNT